MQMFLRKVNCVQPVIDSIDVVTAVVFVWYTHLILTDYVTRNNTFLDLNYVTVLVLGTRF